MTDTPEPDQKREGFQPVQLTPKFLLKTLAEAFGKTIMRVLCIAAGMGAGDALWHLTHH